MTADRETGGPTVACLYYELRESVEANRERLVAGVEEALADADVVVGPETATIGIELDPPEIADAAESLHGETVKRVREVVEREGGVAVFGIPERADGEVYNACVLLEPGCEPRVYRQREYEYTHGWTTAHGEFRVFDTGMGRAAPAVCADLG
ncbi:MAG: nitrilase-related carbon-nitrogen hydrolase, partial [Haloarculaceae archaeon]